MGNAAHLLGIRPWEWDLLTVEQEDVALSWVEQYVADAEEAGGG